MKTRRNPVSRVALDTLAVVATASGHPVTANYVKRYMGLPERTVHWRMQALHQAGLLKEAGEFYTGRCPAKLYVLSTRAQKALARRQASVQVLPLPQEAAKRKGKVNGSRTESRPTHCRL